MKTLALHHLVIAALVVGICPQALAADGDGTWRVDAFTLEVVADPAYDTDALLLAAEGAAAAWNETGAGPQIVVVLAAAGVAGGLAYDGASTLSLDHAWSDDERIAALTMRSKSGDEIVEADTIINIDGYPFVNGEERGAIDLQSIITHELGHSLGLLDDHDHDDATMFYGSKDADISKRTLAQVDVAALRKLYAGVELREGAAGCSSTTADAGLLASLPLVFVIFCRGRRARRARRALPIDVTRPSA